MMPRDVLVPGPFPGQLRQRVHAACGQRECSLFVRTLKGCWHSATIFGLCVTVCPGQWCVLVFPANEREAGAIAGREDADGRSGRQWSMGGSGEQLFSGTDGVRQRHGAWGMGHGAWGGWGWGRKGPAPGGRPAKCGHCCCFHVSKVGRPQRSNAVAVQCSADGGAVNSRAAFVDQAHFRPFCSGLGPVRSCRAKRQCESSVSIES